MVGIFGHQFQLAADHLHTGSGCWQLAHLQSVPFSANTIHMWTNLAFPEPWLLNNHNEMIHSRIKYFTDKWQGKTCLLWNGSHVGIWKKSWCKNVFPTFSWYVCWQIMRSRWWLTTYFDMILDLYINWQQYNVPVDSCWHSFLSLVGCSRRLLTCHKPGVWCLSLH